MEFHDLILAVFTLLLLFILHRLSISPVAAILFHWARWMAISLAVPYFVFVFEWSTRPYWVLAAFCFLLWFLLETLYNWLAIAAWSKSEVPLFPNYDTNDSGDGWPADRRFIGLREWIRDYGFKRINAFKAEISEEAILRISVYENEGATIRVQVLFLPYRNQDVAVCFNLISQTAQGSRLITDNLFLPFGGFYPENWSVERRPWTRSLPLLLKRHLRRMESFPETFVAWDEDPLLDLNDQKRILERINTKRGILFPRHLHEEFGRITWEGRYRFWKELWLLNYFGLTFAG